MKYDVNNLTSREINEIWVHISENHSNLVKEMIECGSDDLDLFLGIRGAIVRIVAKFLNLDIIDHESNDRNLALTTANRVVEQAKAQYPDMIFNRKDFLE